MIGTYTMRRVFLSLALLLSVIALTAAEAYATHFRGTTISWAPTGAPGQVKFTFKWAERRSARFPQPNVGNIISVGLNFGDGTSGTATGPVTSINIAEDWYFAELSVTKTYLGQGPYTAFFQSCCRISTLKLGRDQTMRMETTVRPFSGNSSPVASMPPLITIPIQATTGFAVTASDLERDTLRYRLATNAEMYGGTNIGQPPGLSINSTTGQVTWNTTAIPSSLGGTPDPGDLWAVQVIVEDLDAAGAVKSKIPIDVILKFVANVGTPPTLTLSQPGPISVQAGTTVSFTATGNDADAGARVVLNASGIPTNATATNLGNSLAPPVVSTFTWTPTAAQGGSHVISFTATDDTFQQALKTISIFVENNQPPSVTCPSPLTTQFNQAGSVSVQVSDPNGDALTVVWKVDGVQVRTDNVPGSQSPTTVTLTQTFGAAGAHAVDVTVTDSKAASANCSTTVNVVMPPPTAEAGGPYSVNEGSSVALSGSCTDCNSFAWDLDDDGLFETSGQNVVFSASSIDGPSSRTVRLRATGAGGMGDDTATVNVLNVAPAAVFSAPAIVNAGSTFSVSLNNPLDPSPADTAAGFQYAFDCGAGFGGYGGASTGNCVAGASGTATVRGRIRDKDGGVTEYGGSVDINRPPVCTDMNIVLTEDSGPSTRSLQCQDPDAGNSLVIEIVSMSLVSVNSSPSSGAVTNGLITLTPADNYNGVSGAFMFRARDNHQAVSAPATGYVSVNPSNDPPIVLAPANISMPEGNTTGIGLDAFVDDRETPDAGIQWTATSGNAAVSVSINPATRTLVLTAGEGPATAEVTMNATDRGDPSGCSGVSPGCSPAITRSVRFNVEVTLPATPLFSVDAQPPDPDACICTPLIMNTNPAGIEHWWVKADASGTLKLTVTAHSVNATDPETVVARVYPASGAGLLKTITASYPAGQATGTEVSASDSIGTTPGTVYLVRVTTPSTPPTQPHYSLKFHGATQAAIKSATFASFEPHNNVRWFFNIGSGSEDLAIRVFNEGAPSASAASNPLSANVRFLDTAGAVIADPADATAANPGGGAPFDATFTQSVSGPGRVAFHVESTNFHHRLERLSGADRDVYLTWETSGQGQISGVIQTNSGAASNALVQINLKAQPSGAVVNSLSTSAGTFMFTKVPAGAYSVEIVPPAGGTATPQFENVYVLCDQETKLSFKVNRRPTVNLQPAGPANEPAALNLNSAASDPDAGDTLSYTWTVISGNGTVTPGAPGTAELTADDGPASIVVQLRVFDGALAALDQETIEIRNVAPTANAGLDQTQYWGLPVSFSGTGSDPSASDTAAGLNPAWNFGDGSPSGSGYTASHIYANPGTYNAVLKVTDKNGALHSDGAVVTVKQRETALAYTGDTPVLFGFGGTLSAKLSDTVVPAAQVTGRAVKFVVNGIELTAATNASGVATASIPPLLPGSYPVTLSFAGDSRYLSSATQSTLVVTNTAGLVTAGTMRAANNGRGGFNVRSDGTVVTGELQFQNNAVNFHAHVLTALAVSPDRSKAWFAGIGVDGKAFTAYVEDNGEPGRTDKFRIWIAGVPQNGAGDLLSGNVQIHK